MELNIELVNSGGFSNVYKTVNRESKTKLRITPSILANSMDTRVRDMLCDTSSPPMICIKVSSLDKGTCEYELMRSINHENVINALFGYYDIPAGMYVLGMPLIENELGSEKSINYMHLIKQVLSGLEHLHSHGIVHCDIKPSNILVSRSASRTTARYVIIDLNIANVYKQGGMHKRFRCNLNAPIVGTRQFASLFALLRCLPFCRDDIESFFLVCMHTKFMRNDAIFTDESTSLASLREMRIDMYKYRCIQYLRSMPFYEPLDYSLVCDLFLDEFFNVN